MDFLKKIGKEVLTGSSSSYSHGLDETWYVTAVRAEGIKDKDRFTKSDPYLVIDFGNKSYRTRTIRNDLSPMWNETFTFKLSPSKAKDLYLKLKDDDVGIDDTIGTAVVSRADLPMYSGEEKYIQVAVKKNEEIHGLIHLRIKKIVEGQSSSYPSSTYQQSSQYSSSSYPIAGSNQQYQQSSYPQQPNYQHGGPPQYQQQQQQPYYGGAPPQQSYQSQPQPQYQQYPQQQDSRYYQQGPPPPQYGNPNQYPQQQYNQQQQQRYPYQQYR
jgi:hypothetical protein